MGFSLQCNEITSTSLSAVDAFLSKIRLNLLFCMMSTVYHSFQKINHVEGGWPKELDPEQVDEVAR
jgi:hypothetical protein